MTGKQPAERPPTEKLKLSIVTFLDQGQLGTLRQICDVQFRTLHQTCDVFASNNRAERRRREASRHKCLRPNNPPRPGQPAAIARYCVAGFGARPVSRKTFIYFSGTKKGDPLRLNVGGPSVQLATKRYLNIFDFQKK